ncbi:MAG: adenylate/guanylate cyclase domain-containing protein [Pseudomonadota bacterium]
MAASLFNRLSVPSFSARVRITIALVAVLIGVWAQLPRPAGQSFFADEWLRDRIINLQASKAEEPRILVVDIDEASTAELGPWPWSRETLADLVEKLLTIYSAKGVALDIVLPDARPAGDGDRRLALLAAHAPLVTAQIFEYQGVSETPVRDGQLTGGASATGRSGGVLASGYIANHAGLAGAANVGNIGFIPDPDGVLRRLPLYTRYQDRLYPALTVALLQCCSGGPVLTLPPEPFMRVSYKRDWSAFTVVSAADILKDRIRPDSAHGRLVLVGSSAMGQADRVTTPLAAQRPGLGVHAAMLSTLLDIQQGKAPAPWPGRVIALLFVLLLAGLTIYVLPRRSALASVGLLLGSMLLWLVIAYFTSWHDPHFVTTGPLAAAMFLLAVAVPFQWQLTQLRSRHLLDTLRQYVAREVVDELLNNDLLDPLRPAQHDVTTLIADMEGYTAQVESLPVTEATRLTRDFLECLTGPVLAQRGTLDKYTGDGLVAFWGAPLPNAQHADLALDAALAIVQQVRALSEQRVAQGKMPLRVRIGIESGLAMAGDFGTSSRSIYTAVGDSVNTASRLEQAARDFPHDVIVGAGTVERATRHRFILLGERLLRGKERPTTLFTLDTAPAPAALPMVSTLIDAPAVSESAR